jgi:hypothetical protein
MEVGFMTDQIDDFTRSYAETALWVSEDEDEISLATYGIEYLADSAQQAMREDCDRFLELARAAGLEPLLCERPEQMAHDFWLTRCQHGAGFWNGDYSGGAGPLLTKIAHSFGEATLYVGDNGLIYQAGSEDR